MTYLELVNKVLVRLREEEVTSVQESPYSKLIGELVNVVKREVEDSWNWSHLRTSVVVATVPNLYSYQLIGVNVRSRIIDVYDETSKNEVFLKSTTWFNRAYLAGTAGFAKPQYYNLNGVSVEGDNLVNLFPIPDGVYEVYFSAIIPQEDLVSDGDIIKMPYQMIVEGALGRAISERGDDGGSGEQEGKYQRLVSDYIAFDAANRPDETIWYPS